MESIDRQASKKIYGPESGAFAAIIVTYRTTEVVYGRRAIFLALLIATVSIL
jgi:hypothetical protein